MFGLCRIVPAINETFTLGKLATFNREVTVQEVNESGFCAGGGCVIHGKDRVEGKGKGASLFLAEHFLFPAFKICFAEYA